MKYLRSLGIGLLIFVSKLLPFNWIVGSYHLMFSWTTMMAPVVAQQFGFSWLTLFFIHQKLLVGDSIWKVFLYRIPLLFSAYAFTKPTMLVCVGVPVTCIVLFVWHDIGSVAWVYSLYWLIPIILYFINRSLIAQSLSASFVAHAVGSVIWLYDTEIVASVWIGLIPIVFCERLLMAGGIIILHYAVLGMRKFSKIYSKRLRLEFS